MVLNIIGFIVTFLAGWLIIEKMDFVTKKARPKVKNDKAETAWHTWEFALKVYLLLITYFLFGLSFKLLFSVSIFLLAIGYTISDIYYNLQHKMDWDYPGDGKNSQFEILITKLAGRDYNKRRIASLIVKAIGITVGVLWFILVQNLI